MGVLGPKKKTKVKLPANTPKTKVEKIKPPTIKRIGAPFIAPDATTAYAIAYERWRQSLEA